MNSPSAQAKPFVVGIDRHSSRNFYETTDKKRFGKHPPSCNPNNLNDFANQSISRGLGEFGIDCVFASEVESVLEYIKDQCCKVLLYHGQVTDMKSTTRILVTRTDILFLMLFNDSQLYDPTFAACFGPDSMYIPIPGKPGLYRTQTDGMFAAVKPQCARSLTSFLVEKLMTK